MPDLKPPLTESLHLRTTRGRLIFKISSKTERAGRNSPSNLVKMSQIQGPASGNFIHLKVCYQVTFVQLCCNLKDHETGWIWQQVCAGVRPIAEEDAAASSGGSGLKWAPACSGSNEKGCQTAKTAIFKLYSTSRLIASWQPWILRAVLEKPLFSFSWVQNLKWA